MARRIEAVDDVDLDFVLTSEFDLAIFSCGFESRCVSLAQALGKRKFPACLIFGFSGFRDDPQRRDNDAIFKKFSRKKQAIVSGYNDEEIRRYILRATRSIESQGTLRVLLDYSSMTKTLYSTILSFLHSMSDRNVDVVFSYTMGEHVEFGTRENLGPGRITEIIALPGFEGALPRPDGMVAIFGLGFETLKPISVAERLETDAAIAFIADPGAFPDYGELALRQNGAFIKNYLKEDPLRFPLRRPTTLYRALTEIVTPYLDRNFNVRLVPLGPKPQVLAALLVATKLPEVTVLQVSSARTQPEVVRPLAKNPFVMTKVQFR